MASSSKRQTTMAKIAREQAVREKRMRKQAKKDAKKQAAANQENVVADGSAEETVDPAAAPEDRSA